MRRWGLIVLVMLCQALACESVQDPADAVGLAPDAHADGVAAVWPDTVEPLSFRLLRSVLDNPLA